MKEIKDKILAGLEAERHSLKSLRRSDRQFAYDILLCVLHLLVVISAAFFIMKYLWK